ncbi:MAG: hypothetical protein WCF12_07000, partial [Propionicimonas sp.]
MGSDEFFDHVLRLANGLVWLVSRSDELDADRAPEAGSLVVAGGSLEDRIAIVGAVGLRTIRLIGGAGFDTLLGPAEDVIWSITGDGAGKVAGIEFEGFEDLVGSADNEDTFDFSADGRVAGVVDGGAGGFDSMLVDGTGRSVSAVSFDPHSGVVTVDGVAYRYLGLEPVGIQGAATTLTISGTSGADTMVLTRHATDAGALTVTGDSTMEIHHFYRPTVSLTIDALGDVDSVTISGANGAIDLGGIPLIVLAETIEVAAGAWLKTTGDVTLDASAANPTGASTTNVLATALVNGHIEARHLTVSATAAQTVSLPSQVSNRTLSYNLTSRARAAIGTGAVVNAATLRVLARTGVDFDYAGVAPTTTPWQGIGLPLVNALVRVNATNTTLARILSGATVTVGGSPISGAEPASALISAVDDTDITITIVDGSAATRLDGSLGTSARFAFENLQAHVTLSRDTQAILASPIATSGLVAVRARNEGTVVGIVTSDLVGIVRHTVTKDDAITAVRNVTLGVGGLEVSATSAGTYDATAKDARNDVTGATSAGIFDSNITAGGQGVAVQAQDLSTLTAHAGGSVLRPETPLVTTTVTLAWNLLDRTTSAIVNGSTITEAGDIDVLASSDAILVSQTSAASMATKTGAIGSNAVALAALFAANVVRGAVTASVTTSTLSGLNVRIVALAGGAVIDATSQVSAIAASGGALVDLLPKFSLGVALAVNFIGWAVAQTALGAFLAAINTLLGSTFGTGEEPWAVTATAVDSPLTATRDLTLSARTAELINATVSNTSSAVAEGFGLFNTASGAAGAVVASNKVSSTARASIDATGGLVPVAAGGTLEIRADDSAGIYSNVKLVASSITTNDGGVHALDLLLPADVLSSAGTVTLHFGDTVRLDTLFGNPRYLAEATGVNRQPVDAGNVVALADDYGDIRYTTASGVRLVSAGDVVMVEPGYEGQGTWQASYRYVGANGRVDLGTQDFTNQGSWLRVGGLAGSLYRYEGAPALLDVNSQDYSDEALWTRISGRPQSVYQWLGDTTSLDLNAPRLNGVAVPYPDLGYWKPVSVTDYFPAGAGFDGFNFGSTPSVTVGGVVVLNDVRSEVDASLSDATVHAGDLLVQAVLQTLIRADADATATSSGGSTLWGGMSLAVNAVIATNRVLGTVIARVLHSGIVAEGDVQVEARNDAEIDASVHGAMAASTSSVGLLLAFNTIGWEPTNDLFQTIDNVIGDPVLTEENPVESCAVIENTPVAAAGTLAVLATTEATIRALVGNDSTSAPATIFGFGAMSASGVMSSNRISTRTKAQLDNGVLPGDFTRTSTPALLQPGDRVQDNTGRTYMWVGTTRGPPLGDATIDLSDENFGAAPWRRVDLITAAGLSVEARDTATIIATSALAAEVSSAGDAGSGILNRWAEEVLSDYTFTSNSGITSNTSPTSDPAKRLHFGDRVRVADTYDGPDLNTAVDTAVAGRVFQWMGTDALGANLNLGTQDYTNVELWKELTPTNLVNDAVGYDKLASRGVWLETLLGNSGTSTTFGLLVTNSVHSAVVAGISRTTVVSGGPVSVSATDAASISSSDSSRITGGGKGALIVSNLVLTTADALIDHSPITITTGGLTVDAGQDGQIDAVSTSRIENGDGTSAVLAFNVIGWTPTNLLFSAIQAFLGQSQSWSSELPARASALVSDSALDVAAGISVTAASAAQLNAVAGNDNAVENIAGVILPGAGPDAEQGQVTGFGQNAGVTGLILASNKVSSAATAAITFTVTGGAVTAHSGGVTIAATDTAGIKCFSSVVQSATAQNDPTKLIQTVNDELIPNDYDFTTASGLQTLAKGDRVRLGATYAGCLGGSCGLPGAVYAYVPASGVVQLGTANYSDPLVWKKLEAGAATLDQLYPGIGNITISKAKATGILVVMNDVRGDVKASLAKAVVTATGAVNVRAVEDAWLIADAITNVSASGGSPIGFGILGLLLGLNTSTKGFQIATNLVLASADAAVAGSSVHAASLVVEATNHSGIDATLLSTADTSGGSAMSATLAFNLLGWKPQNIFASTLDAFLGLAPANETQAAAAIASLTDSNVTLTGSLTVSAVNAAILNATVSNAASSVVSGLFNVAGGAKAAILASNKVASRAQALVQNDTIRAGGAMAVRASDEAGIYANVKIVGSSVTTNSGAIDVIAGAISSSVDADFASSEVAGTLVFGDRVRIDAGFGDPDFTTSGEGLQPVTLTPTNHVVALHPTYGVSRLTTASGIRLLRLGDLVTVDQGYLSGGAWGATYRYVGSNARRDLGAQDFLNAGLWRRVGGNGGSVYSYRGTTALTLDINSTDFSDPARWQELSGAPGTVYEYLGTTRGNVQLASENYADLGWWRPVPQTQIFPTFNITNSNSSAMGGAIVLNDVRSTVQASVDGSTVTAGSLEVNAVEQAVIRALADLTTSSSGGSSWDGQGTSTAISGVIATNRVLGSATAVITNSTVTTRFDDPVTPVNESTTGDLTVTAANLAQIDATNLVAASSGAKSIGLVLAFNTLGWNPSATFFALIDAIIGDPLISEAYAGENPIATLAAITGTPLTVAGDLTVAALTDARINALVSNSATSAPAALFGASGTSVGMVVS